MKKLKDSIKKMDEKYVTVEALSEADKKSTYGGGTISASDEIIPIVAYGVPPFAAMPDVPTVKK